MTRFIHPLTARCAMLVLAGVASAAQSDLRAPSTDLYVASSSEGALALRPVTAPIRYAGTYHLVTDTWTKASQAHAPMLGPQDIIIYNNTSPSYHYGYTSQFWLGMPQGVTYTDEGRIPSTTSPSIPSTTIPGGFDSAAGCHDAYTISSFQIAYCTDQSSVDLQVDFQESYPLCSPPSPQHTIVLPGLPAAPVPGIVTCWTVDIDLVGSSATFSMAADGDGVYTGTPRDNLFGWSITLTSPVAPGGGTGPLVSGAFEIHTGTDGTRWDFDASSPAPIWPANATSGPGGGPELGTGMSTLDYLRLDGGTGLQGCFFIDWPPLSLYLVLHSSDICPPPPIGAPFCFGDATSPVPCPCANAGTPGHGCENSVSTGGSQISATGLPVFDDIVLNVTGELPVATSIFLQGDTQLTAPVVFGDGLRCASGHLKRLYVKTAQGGQVSAPAPGDPSITQRSAALGDPIAPGSQRFYQVYYRDPSSTFCPPPAGNTWNVSNATAIVW